MQTTGKGNVRQAGSRLRFVILGSVCAVGFACGGAGNPTREPFVKVTPPGGGPPSATAAQELPTAEAATVSPQAPAATLESTRPLITQETFQDDFDLPAGWAEEDTERYSMGRAEGGAYRMEFYLASDSEVLLSLQPHAFSLLLKDTVVRAEGLGMNENGAFGLVCRCGDPLNYYTFHISTDGRYWLYKQVDGAWTNLGSGTSGEIRESNALELSCRGDTVSAAVNGTTVAEVADGSLTEGNAGLFAQPLGGEVLGAWSYYAAFQFFEMTVFA
ncbi:MAG: hypothetical protein JW929_00055 [Anaerolineales bacterium]|nr:hypothetical protein [Anaerolineales bacterium]